MAQDNGGLPVQQKMRFAGNKFEANGLPYIRIDDFFTSKDNDNDDAPTSSSRCPDRCIDLICL